MYDIFIDRSHVLRGVYDTTLLVITNETASVKINYSIYHIRYDFIIGKTVS